MQLRGHKKEEPVIKAGAVQSDINVTPLVDVCLVLLIIFMVVTPLLQKGVDVALPETTRPEKVPENEQQMVVAVKMDGSVFVGQDWVPAGQLAAAIKKIKTESPNKEIVVKGDKRLRYKEIREVMKVLNDAGFTKVGLIAHKKETGSSTNIY
ncbi:MAG: ExbD/TolR family protein [Acidobacteria bacterium]|nr:ExbD/TolR family protein [Acidobacteriota bacterium]